MRRTAKFIEIVVPIILLVIAMHGYPALSGEIPAKTPSNITNYSSYAREKGLILHTSVTIGYDAPWRQVHELLLMAAARTQGLLKEPPPFVLQKSLDDFYVNYELNVYSDAPQQMVRTYSELHKNIQDCFNEYGVQIMSPHYVSDPASVKIVPKEQWYAQPARPPEQGKSD